MSRRLAPMPPATRILGDDLHNRLRVANKDVGHEIFYFLRAVNGAVDGSTAHWLHADMTIALRAVTGNPSVKIHGMRARTICELAFPDWNKNFSDWLAGSIGPVQLESFFRYDADNAWRVDQTRCSAGHAQVRTTVAHYLYAGFQLRAMALAATLTSLRPTSTLVESLSTTVHALKKQRTRKAIVRDDPWIFVQQHVPKKQMEPSDQGPIQIHSSTPPPVAPIVTPVHFGIVDFQYVALRLAGCTDTNATDALDMVLSKAKPLEEKIGHAIDTSTHLRDRVRGHTGGRAMAADTKLIASDACQSFIALLRRAGPDSAQTLLDLLTQTPHLSAWHKRVLEIEGNLINTAWVLECICDRRFEDAEISLSLSHKSTLFISPPQRDIGRHPRLYVIPKKTEDRNTVVKTRLTTMARLLCKAYTLLVPSTTLINNHE